jgi:hypothetical protein
MNRTLAVLLIAACERESHGVHVQMPPPKVGGGLAYHFRYDSHLTAPDGSEHAGHAELSLTTRVLEVAGGRVQRMRVAVDRDDSVFDGQPKPTLAGTYEITAAGDVTRGNGVPPSDYERTFFQAWHIGNDDTVIAARELHAGDELRPTEAEAIALGLPASKGPWVLHVRHATDDDIELTGDFEPADSPPEVESRATTTITLTPQVRTHVDDLVIRSHGNEVGGAHSTLQLRPQR